LKKKLILSLAVLILCLAACQGKKDTLLIFHAGSLSIPFKNLTEEFMRENPGVVVQTEAAGSRTCARKITELNRAADIMASADSEVIRKLMIPEHAGFCIDFAVNAMTIMYNEKSRFAGEINADNWPDILLRSGVEYGHSDPNADPCGYRTLLCWKLAGKYFKRPGLYTQLMDKRPRKNIRPKEVDLLALLDAGELDYIFIYRSIAEQHKGHYIVLPDEINLRSPSLESLYKEVSVEISGAVPGEKIVRYGAPIIYGITIPNTVRYPELAERFLAFVIGPEGQRIMQESSLFPVMSPRVDHIEALPESLKMFFTRGRDEI
jgi:molybdate/tungstate transport system substrate-binding protein